MATLNGNVFVSTDQGETYENTLVKGRTFRTLEISPNFATDRTIVCGRVTVQDVPNDRRRDELGGHRDRGG